jgi:hypothetical protein
VCHDRKVPGIFRIAKSYRVSPPPTSPPARNANNIAICSVVLKEDQIKTTDTVIAVFSDHNTAEAAVKRLTAGGFEMKNLSVVGKGYHSEEKVEIGSGFGAGEGRSGACFSADCSWPFPS